MYRSSILYWTYWRSQNLNRIGRRLLDKSFGSKSVLIIIPANFFWDISVRFQRFLSWECWDFWRRHDHFWRFPKKSEVFRRRPKSAEVCQRRARSQCFSLQKSEIARKVFPFIHFTHGFRSLHGSELTYFWKLCQAGRQQLTFFNQAWEIGPQAWAGVRSKFSTRRRESWQV